MHIPISNQSDEPIYRQIMQAVKNAVLSGELESGAPLPSIRSLARELGISVITSKRAYEELEKEGYIVTVKGKGSLVGGADRQALLTRRRQAVRDRLAEAVELARSASFDQEEIMAMLAHLLEEEQGHATE